MDIIQQSSYPGWDPGPGRVWVVCHAVQTPWRPRRAGLRSQVHSGPLGWPAAGLPPLQLDILRTDLTNALVVWQQSKKNKQIVHMPQLSAVCGKISRRLVCKILRLWKCWKLSCFSPDGCELQSIKFTYGHRRLLVVGAGPGDEEPWLTVKVFPFRDWRSILLVNSVVKMQTCHQSFYLLKSDIHQCHQVFQEH